MPVGNAGPNPAPASRFYQIKQNAMTNKTTPFTRSFRKGLSELRVKDVPVVKAGIYAILGVGTKQSFARYADGKAPTLDVDKARRIEELFAQYGVTQPWGPVNNF